MVILADADTPEAFEAWLPEARGKFVLVSPPVASCRPRDNLEWFARPETLTRMAAEEERLVEDWGDRYESAGIEGRNLPEALDAAGAAGIIRSQWSEGWGVIKIFGTNLERTPGPRPELRGLRARLSAGRERPAAGAAGGRAGRVPRRGAGLDRLREDPGHRGDGGVRDPRGALRLLGRLLRGARQRHRRGRHHGSDARPEGGGPEPPPHHPRGPLERGGAGPERVPRLRGGPPRDPRTHPYGLQHRSRDRAGHLHPDAGVRRSAAVRASASGWRRSRASWRTW